MDTNSPLSPGDLAARLDRVRSTTERLAEPLSPEDQTVQSMPDVSPTKWHRAHTTWFFETFVLEQTKDYDAYHPLFGYLFNSYYEGVGERYPRPARGLVSRPGAAEVGRYRSYVDDAMRRFLDRPSCEPALALIELGIHHEQQHQELLLMDIKHVLSRNPLLPPYLPAGTPPCSPAPASTWTEHPGGLVDMGHGGACPGPFSFDNEQPRHTVLLPPFALASRPVTCGDWLAFVDDDGYRRAELWLSDGWATVHAEGWDAPLYWTCAEGTWELFTLHGRRPVDPAEPVCHVSYYEADAYARWAGARLPTEFEWEAMSRHESGSAPEDPDAPRSGDTVDGDITACHPRPVGATASMFGDVWQWTSSAYSPYPGFKAAAGAVGEYNGKFMVNQQVLRGGACITPVGHVRPTYRNFFPPSARWPFTGLRLARDA